MEIDPPKVTQPFPPLTADQHKAMIKLFELQMTNLMLLALLHDEAYIFKN